MSNKSNNCTKKLLRIPRSNVAYRRENSYINRNRLSSYSREIIIKTYQKVEKNYLRWFLLRIMILFCKYKPISTK